jgi:hypothetical protein
MTWDQALALAKGFTADGIVTTIHVLEANLSVEDVTKAEEACAKGVKGLQVTKSSKGQLGGTSLYYKIYNGAF